MEPSPDPILEQKPKDPQRIGKRIIASIFGLGCGIPALIVVVLVSIGMFRCADSVTEKLTTPSVVNTATPAEKTEQAEQRWALEMSFSAYVISQHFVQDRLLSRVETITLSDALAGRKGMRIPGYATFPVTDFRYEYLGDATFIITSYADPMEPERFGGRFNWRCKLKYLGGESTMDGSWKILEIKKLPK